MGSARRLWPPTKHSVAESAARDYMIYKPGGGTSGLWSPKDTPYMVEPMNGTLRRQQRG
jgi:phage terminase large subunit GpA-like protein